METRGASTTATLHKNLRSGLPRSWRRPCGLQDGITDYQKNQPDRFHHRYQYDADNRIMEVETSADGANWHRDARYFYYPHGPLARVELGEHLVQGTDYAYTLQGWLKGINGDRLNPATDMGRDGDPTVTSNPNLLAGRDAYALSLGYYGDDDYKAIGDVWGTVAERPFAPIGASGTPNTVADSHKALYNGNIAHTVNTLQPFGLWDAGNGSQGQVLAQVYAYDQLNRLKKARGFTGITGGNTWVGVADAATNRYRSEYEYDANGNIVSAERWNEDGTGHYDSFEYHYQESDNRTVRNRLYELFDNATATTGSDIVAPAGIFENDPQFVNVDNNYGYDALGNLVRDDRAHIEAIDWTVAGKVKRVVHETGEGPGLEFAYGASGQRTMKQVSDPDADDAGYREHYIRDAQGNIMATYRYTDISANASLKLNERPLYGSSRVGSLREEQELRSAPFEPGDANPVQNVDLNYELTDHLGNVAAVVTGRLLDGNGSGTPKQAELLSAQGYEPFGSLLPGRNYNSGASRHLFQGQEHDDEIYGATGTSYAFEYRMHDPRVGRFLSIDPLAAKYAYNSPYAFSENRVLDRIELEGLEAWPEDPNAGPITQAEYQQYAQGKAIEITNDTELRDQFADCADACMLIPIMYHRDKGIPMTLTLNGRTIDSSDPVRYQGDGAFNTFVSDVRALISARGLTNSTVTTPVDRSAVQPGDIMSSGVHANTYLGQTGDDEYPVRAMNASGYYYGPDDPRNQPGTGPVLTEYRGIIADTYRFNFVAGAERGNPVERMEVRQTALDRAPTNDRQPIGGN